jgi:hypothetical protein
VVIPPPLRLRRREKKITEKNQEVSRHDATDELITGTSFGVKMEEIKPRRRCGRVCLLGLILQINTLLTDKIKQS